MVIGVCNTRSIYATSYSPVVNGPFEKPGCWRRITDDLAWPGEIIIIRGHLNECDSALAGLASEIHVRSPGGYLSNSA